MSARQCAHEKVLHAIGALKAPPPDVVDPSPTAFPEHADTPFKWG